MRALLFMTLLAVAFAGCLRRGFEVPTDIGAPGDGGMADGAGNGLVEGERADAPGVVDVHGADGQSDAPGADVPVADGQSDAPGADVPVADGQSDAPGTDVPVADGQSDAPKKDGPASPDQQPGDGVMVPVTWVSIAKGTFTMGSPTSEPCRRSDEDLHQVTLTRDFEIQATEVTQGQFKTLMGYNPSVFNISGGCGTDCPVESVNWHEAAAYCNELSSKAGKIPCYTCSGSGTKVTCQEAAAYVGQGIYSCPGYRLPTEAEWEYSYRAGTQTAYCSGGNDSSMCSTCSSKDANADKIAWYCANAGGKTHPVGQKQANAWMLFDVAGNVWEWCHDLYQYSLGTSAVTDPWPVSPKGNDRVLRGGSWDLEASYMRAAQRIDYQPTLSYNSLGFRCARTIAP